MKNTNKTSIFSIKLSLKGWKRRTMSKTLELKAMTIVKERKEEKERVKGKIPLAIWLGGVRVMGLRESEEAIVDRKWRREKVRNEEEEEGCRRVERRRRRRRKIKTLKRERRV